MAALQPGVLDVKFTIQRKTLARDPTTGAQTWTWTDFAIRWGKVEESAFDRGLEQADGPAYVYARPSRITVRWVSGLTSAMRLRRASDGHLSQIIGIAMVGRNEWHTISCVDFSTENVS
jgi:head-tail adaptor